MSIVCRHGATGRAPVRFAVITFFCPLFVFLSCLVAALACCPSTFGGTCCKAPRPPPVWQHLSWPHLSRILICRNNNDLHRNSCRAFFQALQPCAALHLSRGA